MFAAELLMGGNPITGAVGGLACCAMIGTTIYAMRKKIPHPSEFAIFGCCCLRGGCHKHPKFNLIVEVHEAGNIPKGSPVYVYIECGRFDNKSADNPVDSKTLEAGIFERLNIHVRQMDNILSISLWRRGAINSTLLGGLEFDVVEDIINKDYPQQQWFTFKKEDKASVKVKLSFHRLNTEFKGGTSPLVEYALIHANREGALKGEIPNVDFDSMDEKTKLRFLSRVLEGPLRVLTVTGWIEHYYKAVEGTRDRWQWIYWKSKQAMLNGEKHKGAIPLLAISLVLPDTHNRHQFYVKYHKRSGPSDIFFSRVDRDRDLWSDGLYEFLERLRAYLQAHPPETDAQLFLKEEEQRNAPPRQKIVLDSNVRTLMAPSKKDPTKPVAVAKYRQPASVAAMIEEAMEGYDDEEEDNSDIEPTTAEVSEYKQHPTQADKIEKQESYGSSDFLTREGSTGGPV